MLDPEALADRDVGYAWTRGLLGLLRTLSRFISPAGHLHFAGFMLDAVCFVQVKGLIMKILALLLLPLLLISFQSPPQYTSDAFIKSVIDGDKDKVQLFLVAGMSPDVKYRGKILELSSHIVGKGDTPLIIALRLDHYEISWMLLESGANVNQPGDNECFPLLLAKGSLTQALLDSGADVNQ